MAEKQRFIRRVSQAQIGASTKLEIDLSALRQQFGDDFNTLTITNTDAASAVDVYLDGLKSFFITANNGQLSFDWELGLNYNFIAIENTNAGAVIAADAIKISVGRTGGVRLVAL